MRGDLVVEHGELTGILRAGVEQKILENIGTIPADRALFIVEVVIEYQLIHRPSVPQADGDAGERT